ncbi:proton channel OTOP2-like [Simochromis diagramma]|uniref:proton channel OTOP2-like n=1 Tax=Simochromis diagramma TaxID=43689 RepID=UPI001A7E2462|nr:proton channel OTOP2-like [Simochromis diagramma]
MSISSCYEFNCLTTGNQCEPCRMMAQDKETEEVHQSNNINSPGQEGSKNESELKISSAEVGKEKSQSWGWMGSGIICVNILILGSVLVTGSTYEDINIKAPHLQIFLIIILLLTSMWMIYYSIYTARIKNAVNYKDAHAGPTWLRGGLVLFAVLSIIMDIFKIASYVGYLHCGSAVKVAFPVVQIVFIFVQTYFLWVHSKDCVQLQKNISCCGLMLTLSTNLVLWMTAVAEESVHQTLVPTNLDNITELTGRSLYISRASYGDYECKCSHSSCSIFKVAYYYLYPFNIEYSLFASAMAYIMWKNVGRLVGEHGHAKIKFRLKGIYIGPSFGILLVIAGLATFIAYEMEMKNEDAKTKEEALMMYFVMNIVIVSLMSIVTVIGMMIYRVDDREHVSEKSPTRNLDVGLLVGASLGQFVISYFSIIAMISTGVKDPLNRLDLSCAIIMVIQLGLQNFFIIEGLHRVPFHEVKEPSVIVNPYVVEPGNDMKNHEGSNTNTETSPDMPEDNLQGDKIQYKYKLLWKRQVLKEVCIFLLMGNIILWIMPAFGARPQFDHTTETEFYKFNVWAPVVNVGLPFGIFYRMHSVANLFEVFLIS